MLKSLNLCQDFNASCVPTVKIFPYFLSVAMIEKKGKFPIWAQASSDTGQSCNYFIFYKKKLFYIGSTFPVPFCLAEFPTSRLEMSAVADIFDRDGDGYIDYYEFVAALHPNKDAYKPVTDADKIEDEVFFLLFLSLLF